MIKEEKIDLVIERFTNRFSSYNTAVLRTLGKAIKEFDGVNVSQAHIIARRLKMGEDLDKLTYELAEISEKSQEEILELFDEIAKDNLEFAEIYYKARNLEFKDYANNYALRNYVLSVADITKGSFKNLSRTTGFLLRDNQGNKIFNSLRQTYVKVIDEAVYAVSTGQEDYQSAMYKTIKQLANSGVKKVDYDSGYSRRLDSSVRQAILDGTNTIFQGIQDRIGDEIGSDGVEITAHFDCAEDHLPYQGRQFTDKQFARLQGDLERPIGEYNCRHRAYPIIIGVSRPSYSKKELKNIVKRNKETKEYEGKTYTTYEATQMQRKLETAIRQQKDYQIIAKESGNKKAISEAQSNITALTNKYKDFSDKMGIDTKMNRLRVSGYKRTSVK